MPAKDKKTGPEDDPCAPKARIVKSLDTATIPELLDLLLEIREKIRKASVRK